MTAHDHLLFTTEEQHPKPSQSRISNLFNYHHIYTVCYLCYIYYTFSYSSSIWIPYRISSNARYVCIRPSTTFLHTTEVMTCALVRLYLHYASSHLPIFTSKTSILQVDIPTAQVIWILLPYATITDTTVQITYN